MVYVIQYGLSPVSYSVRKSNQFPVQMRAATVGIVRHIRFAIGILSFNVARHPAVVATATLEVANCILFFHLSNHFL